MIKAKLYMNVHWMVFYKLYVFCSDMKFKMAATSGLSLTLDPMGKMFQNTSSIQALKSLWFFNNFLISNYGEYEKNLVCIDYYLIKKYTI